MELLNNLVNSGEQPRGHLDAECPGGLEVDDQFELGGSLHRQVGWLLALEDAVDVAGRSTILVDEIRPIRDQTARDNELACVVDRRQLSAGCQLNDQTAMNAA